jgi:methionyl-tRNA synthetase
LGNLLSRTLTLIDRFAGGLIPDVPPLSDTDVEEKLSNAGMEVFRQGETDIEEMVFSRALEQIWQLVRASDQYLESQAPWILAKDPGKKKHLERVLYRAADALRLLAIAIYPFMPDTARSISDQLGLDFEFSSATPSPIPFQERQWNRLPPGTRIRKTKALFPRILQTEPGAVSTTGHEAILSVLQGVKTVSDSISSSSPSLAGPAPVGQASQATAASPTTVPHTPPLGTPPQISIDEFMKIQLKTAKVVTAERVPRSEKLIKLIVSLGSEQRQIVAGIGKKYEPADLVGKCIVIVANLKPAKLMGIESQGMVLAAGDKDVAGLVTILEEVEPGTKVK